MNRPSSLCFLLLAIAASPLPSQDQPPKAGSWPRPKPGTQVILTSKDRISQEYRSGKNVARTEIALNSELSMKVAAVRPDGSWVLELRLQRITGTVKTPDASVAFDSTQPTEHPTARAILEDVGQTFILEIDPRGLVKRARRSKKGEPGDDDEHVRQTYQFYIPQLPPDLVKVGTSWKPRSGVHECGPSGCLELITTSTLRSIDSAQVTIATLAVDTDPAKKKPHTRIKRSLVLSRQDGLPVSLTAEGTTRMKVDDYDFVQTSSMSLTRKPAAPEEARGDRR